MTDGMRLGPGLPEESGEALLARAPSRFVIREENDDETAGEIVGWGMAFPDGAVVVPTGDGLANRYSSAERALWIHSAAGPALLTWIDCPPRETEAGAIGPGLHDR